MGNLHETDAEFMERFEQFAYNEVVNEKDQQLEEPVRNLAILATLVGCQGIDAYKEYLVKALEHGMSPVAVKEMVYQATDYLGYGRMLPFLKATNETFENDYGRPSGKRNCCTGRNFRRAYERSVESGTHQPLAGCKLLWRLLYENGTGPCTARNDNLLLFNGTGRM